MSDEISDSLISFLMNLKLQDVPSQVIDKARLCLLDTLGVAVAGSITPIGKVAREFAVSIGGREENTIYNYGDRVSCIPAAYANGTMSFCHNFTDTTLSCVVHCGPVIVPTALSVAEREGSTGKELLAAVIAGYEMMTRVGNVINSGSARMNHHRRGFHATATTGVFGASLTACKLFNLSIEKSLDALGIAGSYACGILESVTSPETETWRTHTGIAAQNGISSAILANLGLKGPATVFKGKNGFFSAFGGETIDLQKLEEDLGGVFLVMDSAFKLHNCAHVWAVPLECLCGLMKKHKFRHKDVSEIQVTIPTAYSYVMDSSKGSKYPRNYGEAQNNLSYVVAAMIVHGGVYIEQFSERVLRDPEMKEIASKVTVKIDPSLDETLESSDKSPARVKIILSDGNELFGAADYPRGAPQNPADREEIKAKFQDLARTVFPKEKALEVALMVDQIEEMNNLDDFIDHLVVRNP